METRSRKRAEASSAAPPSSSSSSKQPSSSAAAPTPQLRASKRARVSVRSPSIITTRSRQNSIPAAAAAPAMDSSNNESSASGSRRDSGGRRGPGKNQAAEREKESDKGKEKEPEIRVRDRERDRDAERNLGSSIDGGDDNDSDGGVGMLHHNLTSAMQGLLRKLGAGLDSVTAASSSQQNSRLKKILAGLRADGEEGRQVEALTQLCEMLSIGTEDSLSTFSVDSFVPILVGLLNHESNADIMLLAARALTHLCDVLPSSCSAVVHYGAVSCFCARLLTIEYMDLAEQVRPYFFR